MPSKLTFDATENFRKKLLVRNLPPYDESYKTGDRPGESELTIKDVGVVNSQNVQDSDVNKNEQIKALVKNQYGPEDGFKKLIDIRDIQKKIDSRERYYTFIASTYSSFNLLTSLNPTGNNGSLSQDSALARIAAQQLKTEFEYRVGEEVRQETLGRINVLDALSDPFDAIAIATGNEQVIESNWQISVPDSVAGKGLDFISRITGVYSPYSWIPGDYFGEDEKKSFFSQVITGIFGERGTPPKRANKNSSEIFLSNTGRGQTKRLFKNLEFNRYSPDYTDNSRSFGLKAPQGNYYVGSKTEDPLQMPFPNDELPTNEDGNKSQSPVKGYGELGKSYEDKDSSNQFKFGLNGSKLFNGLITNSSYESNRLQGGFVWLSTKTEGASKKRGTIGGGSGSQIDTNSGYLNTPKSNNYGFTKGSILDDTQRLIDAANELGGDKKLQHVGNAINQISKVFNDGTREMTKGSTIVNYENTQTGAIEGTEYCRVFTKDIPYNNVSTLQKSQGITTQNRKFSYSVLDSTHNLNIAPNRGNESTNLTETNVKKYMFSIENLAWRTGSKPGFTYQDLPLCERGPNRGRIMWFPPYDIKVSEQNSANWTSNEFLGRPEPIFTYNNTTRQGSLSWKIIVDHPSILNAIVDKELANEPSEKVNAIVDSFFAGCRTYDIYDLATKFPQFNYSELYDITTKTENITEFYDTEGVRDKEEYVLKEPVVEEYTNKISEDDYNYSFYFENNEPGPRSASSTTTEEKYSSNLTSYSLSQSTYITNADETQKAPINEFFNYIINIQERTKNLTSKIRKAIDDGAEIKINLTGNASSPSSNEYNQSLSKRRVDSIKKYILTFSELNKYEDKITFNEVYNGEEGNVFLPNNGNMVTCSEEYTGNQGIYSVNSMACRSVSIDVEEVPPPPFTGPPEAEYEKRIIQETYTIPNGGKRTRQEEVQEIEQKKEVAKIVVKKLLTECDYFEAMSEDSPFIYQGIKEKIKYFNPTFHSITPEGLNSRLTFLQQCLRPGDTIPVIGEDGKPREGDIKNTAFGAPPVCVLRIGDFYHTKIVIQQMSINYEPLVFDLNPEGIGVQPMIADINMSFYFIGGQGLKEPVARLQNALSFNYYGNTEIYDERAEVTDIESRDNINRTVIENLENITGLQLSGNTIERSEEAGDTIGEITDTIFSGNNLAGEINYKNVVVDFVKKSQDYTQNVLNTLETIVDEQSLIGLYYFTKNLNYKNGYVTGYLDNINPLEVNIFGKPVDIQNSVDTLYSELINDVDTNINPFLSEISVENFKNSDIRKFRKNLKSFINYTNTFFQANFNSTMFDLLETQTELVRSIDKLNLIITNTDGYREKSGRVNILELTPTNEVDVNSQQTDTLEELVADMQTVGLDLQDFYNSIFQSTGLIPEKNDLYTGFLSGDFNTPPQTRWCTISFPFMMLDPEEVKSMILGEELREKSDWVNYVNRKIYGTPEIPNNLSSILGSEGMNQPILPAQPGLLDIYKELQQNSLERFKGFKESEPIKLFTLYQPFNLDRVRNFTYIQYKEEDTPTTEKVYYFNQTFKGVNSGPPSEYNEKYSFNWWIITIDIKTF